jgi:hypothetical protein
MIDLVLGGLLSCLAALHVYWGLGGLWPARDQLSLARTIAGFRGIKQMPSSAACFGVAIVLGTMAVGVLLLSGRLNSDLPQGLLDAGGFVLAAGFLFRGAMAYVPAWRRLTPEQPFARLDTLIYGPLCLGIGAMAAAVALTGR